MFYFYYNNVGGITILRVILVPGPRNYTIILFVHEMFKLIDAVNVVEKRPDKMSVNVFRVHLHWQVNRENASRKLGF